GGASDPRRSWRGARRARLLRPARPWQGSPQNIAAGPRALRSARDTARLLARRREGRDVAAASPDSREARVMALAPTLALRLVTYLLVCNGIASLLLAGLIGPLGTALVVLAVLWRWWLVRARDTGVVCGGVSWTLVP